MAGFCLLVVAFAVVLFVVFILAKAVRIVNEYERGVIFRLGRVQGRAKGPGLFLLFPMVDKMIKFDLRTVTMDVLPQDVITRDNAPARVNAVVYFPGHGPEQVGRGGIELRPGNQPDKPDDPKERPRTEGPRRPVNQPRGHKRGAPNHNRRPHRSLGGEGQGRGGQGRGDTPADAAGDGTPSGERAGEAGEDHSG